MGSQSMTRIKPGQTVWEVDTIGSRFDLSVAGDYLFDLSSTYKDEGSGTTAVATAPPVTFHVGGKDLTTCEAWMQYALSEETRKSGASATAAWLHRGVAVLNEAARTDGDREVRAAAQAQLNKLRDDLQALLAKPSE
jgi:hypothetical protein